jgi:hypothetical protein
LTYCAGYVTQRRISDVERTTGFKYVVKLIGRNAFQDETVATLDVAGDLAVLTAGLRPWLLGYLSIGSREDGWYAGCLVTTDDDGHYDTYLAVAVEDVIWYWDEECVPLSQLDTSGY